MNVEFFRDDVMNMHVDNLSVISRLKMAHQISAILPPLLEALEIQRKGDVVKPGGISPDQLAEAVFDAAAMIMTHFSGKRAVVIDQKQMLSELLIVLSKSLRNSFVMFGNSDLTSMTEDLISMIDSTKLLKRWVVEKNPSLEQDKNSPNEESSIAARGLALSEIAGVLMPVFIFHNTLYSIGRVSEDTLHSMNSKVSDFIANLIFCFWDKLCAEQPAVFEHIKHESMFTCTELMHHHFRDIQKKIIKKDSDIDAYIRDPIPYWEKITPGIASSFQVLSDVTTVIMNRLYSQK